MERLESRIKLLEGSSSTSPVLWHFTGGPNWDEATGMPGESIKPADHAYDSLINILRESNLRLSSYREKVSYKVATPSPEIGGVTDTISLNPVCCLAEIPVHNLRGHSDRYGKFALGFHRSEVLHFGFRPVIYALDDDWILNEIRKEWYKISFNQPAISTSGTGDVMDWPEDTPQQKADKEALIEHFKRLSGYEKLLCYVKSFDRTEFETIYSEREWRSLAAYAFNLDHLDSIVVPRGFRTRLKEDLPDTYKTVQVRVFEEL